LGDEDIIGFHRDLPPFRGKRMDCRHFPVLTQRRRMPPPQLPVLSPIENPEWKAPSVTYIDPDSVGNDLLPQQPHEPIRSGFIPNQIQKQRVIQYQTNNKPL
jgi:hypothetical protein